MKLISCCLSLCLSISLFGQNTAKYWQSISSPELSILLSEKAVYQIFKLDTAALQTILQQKSGFLNVPLPDGTFVTLQTEETAVMSPALADRYSNIRSFQGVSEMAKLDLSPYGFHAMMEYQGRMIYIDPLKNQPNHYISYYADEIEEIDSYSCATLPSDEIIETNKEDIQTRSAGVDLRIYRLAIACTGEFTQQFGGTIASALATVVSAVNRLNYIYGRELGVNFQLVTHNDQLIFTDPETDPFPTTDQISNILSKSSVIFRDSLHLSFEDYDIGHIFVVNCDGVNGIAYPNSVCGNNRASGVTCFTSSNLDAVVTSIFAHEVGHQFGATHTFSASCNANQVNAGSQVEPFCGYTIMSYNTTDKLPYFHGISLEQMTKLIRFRAEEGCGISVPTNNQNAPNLEIKFPGLKTIPKETPFELTAIGTDADGDSLTYSWEQIDNGTSVYRSYAPDRDSVKSFPSLPDLLNGSYPEIGSSRDLTFRCTVRDNNPEAGAIAWQDISVTIAPNGESFQVISPNSDTVVWQGGSQVEVRWDVAETNNAIVNCQIVNILLSIDGGYTYPILLAQYTPNTGSATVSVPNVLTTQARLRIEAADHIFFDISDKNFTIQLPDKPTFSARVLPKSSRAYQCISTPIQYTIDIDAGMGYNQLITLALEGNLPAGTQVVFSKKQFQPPATVSLDILFEEQIKDTFHLQVLAVAADGTTKSYPILFNTVPGYFNEIKMLHPANGQSQTDFQNVLFSWNGHPDIRLYEYELATNPAFSDDVIIERATISNTFYIVSIPLGISQVYYWRVRPINECNEVDFLEPFVFQINLVCRQLESIDTPIDIPQGGGLAIQSVLHIDPDAIIKDVNISNIQVEYEPVLGIRLILISPDSRQIVLYEQECGFSQQINVGFDNESPIRYIPCPPQGGELVRPRGNLTSLTEKSSKGDWTLRVETTRAATQPLPGKLKSWTLELCAGFSQNNPTIIKNDTLETSLSATNTYTQDELLITDLDNTSDQLTYTLMVMPRYGALRLQGEILKIGDHFTQQDIEEFRLQYIQNGIQALYDNFTFVVQDSNGGWLSPQKAYIKIDKNVPVGIKENRSSFAIKIFPNPAKDLLNIQLDPMPKGPLTVSLYNMQGQEVQRTHFDNTSNQLQLSTSEMASGMYFLTIRTAEGMVTKKVTVQR